MKNKQLYLQSGYLDFAQILDDDYPISFVIGGRGTGKSYGALQELTHIWKNGGKPFIFMRRTGRQADIVASQVFSPFKPLNDDNGWNINPFPLSKGISAYYESEIDDDGKLRPVGGFCAVIAALSTFSNMRGFSGNMFDMLLYDECIKNKGEKSIKDEGFALKNVYETINRNRELHGQKPLKMICMSNSNAIDNDLFIDFELINPAEFMITHNRNQYYDDKRGIALYNLTDSPISRAKADTILYKADNTDFSKMALANIYEDYDTSAVKSEPLKEFKPMCEVGELCIYKHKAYPRYYVSFHKSGTSPIYGMTQTERTRFLRRYPHLWDSYISERMTFESFLCKKTFEKIFA